MTRREDAKDWVLVTGGSGFLGRHVVRRLRTQGRRVVVLSRSARQQMGATGEGVRFARGDVTHLRCGLSTNEYDFVKRHVSDVVHCAANVSFKPGADVYKTNVNGTLTALRLALDIGSKSFHHVSTAYVAGTLNDMIREKFYHREMSTELRNDYERSKYVTELGVRDSVIPWNVYRPAIIIGEFASGATTCWTAFYAFLRLAWWYASHADDMPQIDVPCTRNDNVNLCHVDNVANVICAGVKIGARLDTYHVAPRFPMRAWQLEETLRGVLKYPKPNWAGPGATNLIMEAVPEYAPYWGEQKIFDTTNARRLLAAAGEDQWQDPDWSSIERTIRYSVIHRFGRHQKVS